MNNNKLLDYDGLSYYKQKSDALLDAKQDTLVSGTNIKTVNNTSLLGGGNIDTREIFIATYGTTTFAEVTAAVNANMLVLVVRNDVPYTLCGLNNSGTFYFSNIFLDTSTFITISSNDTWSLTNFGLQGTSSKVTTLSSSSTDAQYPSAKATYDNVQEAKKQMLRELYLAADARPDSDPNKLRYNDTDQDIMRVAEWGECIPHKAGHYWMNGLGDITEEQMALIYAAKTEYVPARHFAGKIYGEPYSYIGAVIRTNYPYCDFDLDNGNICNQLCFKTQMNVMNWNCPYSKRGLNIIISEFSTYSNLFYVVGSAFNQIRQHLPSQLNGEYFETMIKENGITNNVYTFWQIRYIMICNLNSDVTFTSQYFMFQCLRFMITCTKTKTSTYSRRTQDITITLHHDIYSYLTDSEAMPPEHSGEVTDAESASTVTPAELIGIKGFNQQTHHYEYATKEEWLQIVTDAATNDISFASYN